MKDKGYFNVAGMFQANDDMEMTRMQWVAKYLLHGSRIELEREPDNPVDKNAIKVVHVLAKSGKRITIGYVPNPPDNPKKQLANEFAPLMDMGWVPKVKFSMMFINEKTGEHRGLQLSYPKR